MTGAELRQWREAHGIPRKVLAQAVGYAGTNAIGMIELGYRSVSPRVLTYVATATPPPVLTHTALRAWREHHGWTRRQVALRLGRATESAVTMWELGYRTIPWRVREYVAMHPVPPWSRRPVPPICSVREDVFAAVQAGATTSVAVQCVLPYRISIDRVRDYLRQLEIAGHVNGHRRGYEPKVWRAAAPGPRAAS